MTNISTPNRICPVCRATVLSQYNSDPLCASCARASRDSGGIAPTWLWDSAPMREALARVDIPAVVAIFRSAAGLSQMELGNLIEGWSQSLVSLTERGLRDTLYDIRRLLAFADTVGMPRQALAPLILGRPDAILESDDVIALWGVDTMDLGRREFGTLVGGLATLAVLPVPDRVDRAHVRYLQAALVRLRSQDSALGGGAVLAQMLRHFAHARRMLDQSDYSATLGRELLVVAADLGIESAWCAYDANNQRLARRLHEEAALLVDAAEVSEQRAHLYVNMVQQGTWLAHHTGNPGFAREALRFAGRACDAIRHEPSPSLHALVAIRQSLAYAQVGDEVAFRSSITSARRELDRGPHETDPRWTAFVSHSEITGTEAAGKARLGALNPAIHLYESVLDDTARSPRDHAFYRSKLAEKLVTAGDVDPAVAHGLMVLPDADTPMSSGRVLRNLRPVREAADTIKAAEFCEKFDAAARALHTA